MTKQHQALKNWALFVEIRNSKNMFIVFEIVSRS